MRRARSWLRPLAGVVIIGVLVWRIGTGAIVEPLRQIDPSSLAAGAGIAAVTTVCGAWRWVLVARGLKVELSLRAAVAECYRSQFLNVTLPGGVLGDLSRGVRRGRDTGDIGRGLRSVVWERSAGQAVLGVLTLGAVLLLPSPLQVDAALESPVPAHLLVVSAVAAVVVATVVVWSIRPHAPELPLRVARAAVADLRAGLLGRHTWPGVVVASAVVVCGHVATFVVAARTAGVRAPVPVLVPLALLILVAMGLPLNVAGWGPREGAAAWAFGVAGLGATGGLGTAVVYGVIAFVASLPGAALLLVSRPAGPVPSSQGRSRRG
jgi:glycosyltransferase 2 family protein